MKKYSESQARAFGKLRGRWLDQIHDDEQMTGDDCRVMYAITRCLGTETGKCRAGNVGLAEKAHVHLRTARRAIAKAEARGHLLVKAFGQHVTRELAPVLKSEGTNCHLSEGDKPGLKPSLKGVRGDIRGDIRGDKDFEVRPQNQEGGGVSLSDSLNSLPYSKKNTACAPRTAIDFTEGKEAKIRQDQDDDRAFDVVLDVLESYGGDDGRMMIGGIIDCARRPPRSVEVTGAAIARLAAAGRLKRDGKYVSLPANIAAANSVKQLVAGLFKTPAAEPAEQQFAEAA